MIALNMLMCHLLTVPTLCWASQVALVVRKLPANAGDTGDMGLIPGLRRSLEESVAAHSSILA